MINYHRWLEEKLLKLDEENKYSMPKRLLLHSCCAPCSSYVLEYLSQYLSITVLYYNPNIVPKSEYDDRIEEQRKLIAKLPVKYPLTFEAGLYEPEVFYEMARDYQDEKEGGIRCFSCYKMRLREAAKKAKAGGYDYFTSSLSISPLKNAGKLNEIGARLEKEYNVLYLYSDFKKKNGYQRSVELSGIYHLYRQNYCGCEFSKIEAGINLVL